MASQKENHENPGIFIRIFNRKDYEIYWLDGHGVIEMATEEEAVTQDSITGYLERQHVDSYVREMYSPWGEFEGVAVLRRLTLYESVHYLGRNAKVCAFLRPKIQAERFIEGLKKSKEPVVHRIAAEMQTYLRRFDEDTQTRFTEDELQRIMEEQLLNITADLDSSGIHRVIV